MNVLRGFSRRAGRLGGTLAVLPGVRGRSELGQWLLAFLSQLFDLCGGPEATQLGIRLVTRASRLTLEEVAVAASVLGPSAITYDRVRIAQGGLLRPVFRFNGNRAFATWRTVHLPESGRHSRDNLALLVHELTHVYQFERLGTLYMGQALQAHATLRSSCYDYGGPAGLVKECAAGKPLRAFNREQQGQIAQDYYARRQQGQDTAAYEPYIEQLQAGLL